MPYKLFATALLVIGSLGCGDGAITRDRDMGVRQDVWSGVIADKGTPDTLPANPGDPCPTQECASGLVCVAAQCRRICKQPKNSCNHVASECAASETCVGVTSFSDACMPGTANAGQACSKENQCVGGLLCVDLGTGKPTCLNLCTTNPCQTTDKCVESTRGCKVCIPK